MGHGLWVHGQLLLAREGDHGVELQPDVGTDLHAHPQPQTSVGGGEVMVGSSGSKQGGVHCAGPRVGLS